MNKTISANNYPQFHDYLTQLIAISKKNPPLIKQQKIAELLTVDSSGVSRFLAGSLAKPKTMLTHFIMKYPAEYERWPKEETKIGRMLTTTDQLYFLNLIQPQKIKKNDWEQNKIDAAAPVQKKTGKKAPGINPQLAHSIAQPKIFDIQKRAVWNRPTTLPAPIAISYRGHESDKDAKGMLFDHMLIQKITNTHTVTLLPDNATIAKKVDTLFRYELKNCSAKLPYGQVNSEIVTCPLTTTDCADLGLLIIPGRIRKIENEPIRLEVEYRHIKKALNRGQPLLGICAGSWRIWEQLFVWTKHPDYLNHSSTELVKRHKKNISLISVTDHSYGGGMLRLNNDGVAVCNVQIHDVLIQKSSLLSSMLGGEENRLPVNSVHWKAVNDDLATRPLNILISATAIRSPQINLNTRQSKKMEPQEGTVEAFETDYGTPIMGIQWHPEGYPKNSKHGNIIRYMALAGTAYQCKRKVLKQLEKRFHVV